VTALAIGHLDARTEAYVDEVLRAIETHVPIVEAYLVGSGAAGGFDSQTSDVDLVIVITRELGDDRGSLVDHLFEIECPVRDLQLVAYVDGAQPPDFELNVNQGEERRNEDAFCFVLDAAVAEERAVPLRNGLPWAQVFPPVSKERVREAARASLAWSARQSVEDEFVRLNATRARHYLADGEWISKAEARR
jgi:predicted nucleotidyltransferase